LLFNKVNVVDRKFSVHRMNANRTHAYQAYGLEARDCDKFGTAGVHGRKELTNLSFLAGLAYTEYSENSYHVSSALVGVFALGNDFTDWARRDRHG
jgi:hypothetical protein